ncbi:protein FAM181B [Apteryx mantelli]|uniref:Protein FAM181B n=1 Tax=Apteryx mantelli TaxID=2696672 RepID=A0ABM4DYZ8_9AVES
MAVPAALLSPHHLLSLCFPAAGGLLGYAELEKGCAAAGGGEAADLKEAARDLLSFMDSASSNIKLALDKPGKSRRKVNHRKYLQKQIKRCTGIVAAPPAAAEAARGRPAPAAAPAPCPGGPGKAAARREAAQAASSLQSRSLAALFDSLHQAGGGARRGAAGGGAEGGGGGAARKVPLRDRNLPPSFFTEPALPAAARAPPPPPPPGPKEPEKGGGAEAAEFLELLGAEYGALLPEHAAAQDAFAGRLPAELGLEHGLYEAAAAALPAAPHPLLGGLLYPEPPWSPHKKAPPEALRPLPAAAAPPLYAAAEPPPPAAAAAEEPGGHLAAAFGPFFPECPLPPPQGPYDYGAGYHRAAYSGL